MKLILSRKGFDGTAGGGASPIMRDGRLLSLPIPEPTEEGATARYEELADLDGTSYLQILNSLGYSRYNRNSTCHLDPDLVPSARERFGEWRGMLGQAGAAATHLVNQGVRPGDLFLFWGLYARAGTDAGFQRERQQHTIFGYLEIEQILDAGAGEILPGAEYHPHFSGAYRGRSNRVYVATKQLSHDHSRPGWGVFRWNPRLTLSAPASGTLTSWRLPECFHPSTGTVLSYHVKPDIWTIPDQHGNVTVERKGQGQEFVCDASDAVRSWTLNIIDQSDAWCP
jgi:hypothetical protein